MSYIEDIEVIREKAMNEEDGLNPDKWLDQAHPVPMKDDLRFWRQEFMTSIGPIRKVNSPNYIVDAVNEAYK